MDEKFVIESIESAVFHDGYIYIFWETGRWKRNNYKDDNGTVQ